MDGCLKSSGLATHGRNFRHDAQCRHVGKMLHQAGHVITYEEQTNPEISKRRAADILVGPSPQNPSGPSLAIDVTVVSPFAGNLSKNFISADCVVAVDQAAKAARDAKNKKHQRDVETAHEGLLGRRKFLPLVQVSGGWCAESEVFLNRYLQMEIVKGSDIGRYFYGKSSFIYWQVRGNQILQRLPVDDH